MTSERVEPGGLGSPEVSDSDPDSGLTQGTRPSSTPIFRINEDWAATIFGLALLVLVLAGVVTLDWLP